MLQLQNIRKSYGKNLVLQDINFSIAAGEIIGLVGKNGAGKSTLLHIIATLLPPSAGSMRLNNLRYGKDNKAIKKMIGFVPQEIAIWENLSVKENMQFFAKLAQIKVSDNELQNLCKQMALQRWDEPVHTLSGGMKRKLNLAISLIHQPKLLLLDEPTVGIDLKSKLEIAEALKALAQKGVAMLYISHDMDEILHLCDRILNLGDDDFYKNLLLAKHKPSDSIL